MSFFADKRFEEMDWISKAVEPIEAPIVKILAELPEESTFDFNDCKLLMAERRSSYYGDFTFSIRDLLNHIANKLKIDIGRFDDDLVSCFKIVIEPDSKLDFTKGTMEPFKLVKAKAGLTDKELQRIMIQKCAHNIGYISRSGELSHFNEILELIGAPEEALRSKSSRKKVYAIIDHWRKIMHEDLWKIRSLDLALKATNWITSYANDGDLAAWANLCKLKVMTHTGNPLYSMEEVK